MSYQSEPFQYELAAGAAALDQRMGFFKVGGIDGSQCLRNRGADHTGVDKIRNFIQQPVLLENVGRVEEQSGKHKLIPHGIVLFIGALCFIVFLTEGALLDWSAVFLTSVRGMDASQAGLGYAAFALTMTMGRLTGDRVVQRIGPIRIVIFGGLCAAAGIALATLIPSWQAALLG